MRVKLKLHLGIMDMQTLYKWSIDVPFLYLSNHIGVQKAADFHSRTYLFNVEPHTAIFGWLCSNLMAVSSTNFPFDPSVLVQSALLVGVFFLLSYFRL